MTDLNYFIFDGLDSRDYGIYVYPLNIDSAPQREYTEVVIAGRQGTLTLDNKRNENVVHSYQGIIFSETIEEDLADFRSAIGSVIGTKRLSDSINPSEFYMARYMEEFAPILTFGRNMAKFEIDFNRNPQRFLVDGENAITITAGTGKVVNPTKYASRPLFKVTGYGNLGVGDATITIAGSAGQVVYIDCDMMDAYMIAQGGAISSANDKITLTGNDYPTLPEGETNISLASTITSVEITPRWWRL